MAFTKIRSAEEFQAVYSKRAWNVDVEVCIDLDSPITNAEIDERIEAIEHTLRGEHYLDDGGQGGRGFGFFAEDADWYALDPILAWFEFRSCIVEFNDWYDCAEENAE